MRVYKNLLCVGLGLGLLMASAVSFAAPIVNYWPIWNKSNERNSRTIDHSALDDLLRTYVISNHPSGINRFRYADVSRKHRRKLTRYINAVTSKDPRDYSRAEQKAYWLNLYNALTLKLILDNYPVDSIENIPGPPGRSRMRGPWNKKMVRIERHALSLNDIQHRILRPIWQDHRTHFGLACGGLGCPNLLPRAFTAANHQILLKLAGYDFVRHPRGVQLENGVLKASKLFLWYKSDFAKSDEGLLRTFGLYSEDRQALFMLGYKGRIVYNHDWRINAP